MGSRSMAVVLTALLAAAAVPCRGQGPGSPARLPESELLRRLEERRLSEATAPAALDLAVRWLLEGEWTAAVELLQEAREAAALFGQEELRSAADDRLAAIHRLVLRPAAGEKRWQRAREVATRQVELRNPVGVAARGDADLIVVDEGRDLVVRIQQLGGAETVRTSARARRPAWGAGGEIVITDRDGAVKTLSGAASGRFRPPGVRAPLDFQEWPGGGWLVLLETPETVWLAADGSELRRQRPPAAEPTALATGPLGNLYVLDEQRGGVVVLDRQGQPLETVGPTLPGGIQLRRPRDVAVDDRGRLFIADRRAGLVVVE